MTSHVLIADDDPTVADVVCRYLHRDGFSVQVVYDGESALSAASSRPPDVVILDLMLPGIDGLEVCRRLRESRPVPIVMLSALAAEADRIVGLELGADDYVTKPFSPRELALRVRSVLRRTGPHPSDTSDRLVDGALVVDTAAHTATLDGRPLTLTVREYDLLVFLMRHERKAFGRADLLEQVWGWTYGDASTVTVHVRRLREKIESDPATPARIVTVRGVGYRYESTGSAT
jgi:DNA-binding response OmpR family regulator